MPAFRSHQSSKNAIALNKSEDNFGQTLILSYLEIFQIPLTAPKYSWELALRENQDFKIMLCSFRKMSFNKLPKNSNGANFFLKYFSIIEKK